MRISDWSSDVCSSDLFLDAQLAARQRQLQDADQKRADFNAQYLGSLPGTGSLQDRINAARSQLAQVDSDLARSEERRVGKECVSTFRSRWSPDHEKNKEI